MDRTTEKLKPGRETTSFKKGESAKAVNNSYLDKACGPGFVAMTHTLCRAQPEE